MTQKSIPLTVEGFIERLKREGFAPVQIHTSLARRNYLVGDVVLWCTSQGKVSLVEKAEYDEAGVKCRKAQAFAGEFLLYYEEGVEQTLAEIRKRVTPVPAVPEPEPEKPIVLRAPWTNKRMEITNEGNISVTEETPTVDFRAKPGDA